MGLDRHLAQASQAGPGANLVTLEDPAVALDGLAQGAGPGLGIGLPLAAADAAEVVAEIVEAVVLLRRVSARYVDGRDDGVDRGGAHETVDDAGERADMVLIPRQRLRGRRGAMSPVGRKALRPADEPDRLRRPPGPCHAATAGGALGAPDQRVRLQGQRRQIEGHQRPLEAAAPRLRDPEGDLGGDQSRRRQLARGERIGSAEARILSLPPRLHISLGVAMTAHPVSEALPAAGPLWNHQRAEPEDGPQRSGEHPGSFLPQMALVDLAEIGPKVVVHQRDGEIRLLGHRHPEPGQRSGEVAGGWTAQAQQRDRRRRQPVRGGGRVRGEGIPEPRRRSGRRVLALADMSLLLHQEQGVMELRRAHPPGGQVDDLGHGSRLDKKVREDGESGSREQVVPPLAEQEDVLIIHYLDVEAAPEHRSGQHETPLTRDSPADVRIPAGLSISTLNS